MEMACNERVESRRAAEGAARRRRSHIPSLDINLDRIDVGGPLPGRIVSLINDVTPQRHRTTRFSGEL